MNSNSLEIERRFLILRPPEPELAARCSHVYHMEQTYLLSPPHQTERVRRREGADGVAFFHTVKIDRSAITRLEQEEEITPEAYDAYLTRRDPMTETIRKTRYCLPEGPYTFEIDFYPFWPPHAPSWRSSCPGGGYPLPFSGWHHRGAGAHPETGASATRPYPGIYPRKVS